MLKNSFDYQCSKRSIQAISQLSFTEGSKKQSSLTTIAGITNTMSGSVVLVVPHIFIQYGIITSLIAIIIVGLAQYKTCEIFILHQKDNEDTEQMIQRILGKKWTNIFRLVSGTLLFFVGVVYFQEINLTLFPILEFLFVKSNYLDYAGPEDGIVFDKFSIQWQAIIIFLPLSLLLLYKDISKLIILSHYGLIAIITYCLFIVYIFITATVSDEFQTKKHEINWFTWNFSQPAGVFAFAFMVHNTVGQMIKHNRHRDNNIRDLFLSYLLASIIYGIIGIFGAIALIGRQALNPQTILDYFDIIDVAVLVIETLFLTHLITAFPIFPYISKYQILEALYPSEKDYPKILFWGFNVIFMVICLGVQVLVINVGVVIGFDGAVCGFLLMFIFPIYAHFKCYYNDSKVSDALINKQQDCEVHPNKNRVTKITRIVFYALILCVGLFNMFIQFYDMFI